MVTQFESASVVAVQSQVISRHLTVTRTREGKKVQVDFRYEFGWCSQSKQTYMQIDEFRSGKVCKSDIYWISEHPCCDGRLFNLKRLGWEEASYWTLIPLASGHPSCDCKGFESRCYCKHWDCLNDAVCSGVLDLGWEREPEPYPSEQQILDEANLPF